MEKNYFFKSFQLGKQFLFVLFFLSQVIVAQTYFDAGDKVELFFADGSTLVIADDTDGDATNNLSALDTNDDLTPLMGVGDYIVYRNSGTEGGVPFDLVIEVVEVLPFPGTIRTDDGDVAFDYADSVTFVMPNVSSSNYVSFQLTPTNVFSNPSDFGTEYYAKFEVTAFTSGTISSITDICLLYTSPSPRDA